MLNIPDPSGFGLFVVAPILVSLALVPVAVARVEAPPLPKLFRYGFRELYAISPLGMLGTFTSGLILGAFYGLAPYFASQAGLDVSGTTVFMGAAIVGGVVLQWPIGRLSDRFDRRPEIIWLAIAITVTSFAMAASTGFGEAAFILLAPVFGGVIFTLYPICVAYANDHIEPADLVATSGGLVMAYGVGATLGPLGASAAMSLLGGVALFAFTGAVALSTALFSLWRMSRREAPPIEDQGDFRPVPRTTPLASKLDPRANPD